MEDKKTFKVRVKTPNYYLKQNDEIIKTGDVIEVEETTGGTFYKIMDMDDQYIFTNQCEIIKPKTTAPKLIKIRVILPNQQLFNAGVKLFNYNLTYDVWDYGDEHSIYISSDKTFTIPKIYCKVITDEKPKFDPETITFEQIKQDIRSNVAHPCYSAFEKEMGYRLEEIHDNYYKISYDKDGKRLLRVLYEIKPEIKQEQTVAEKCLNSWYKEMINLFNLESIEPEDEIEIKNQMLIFHKEMSESEEQTILKGKEDKKYFSLYVEVNGLKVDPKFIANNFTNIEIIGILMEYVYRLNQKID